jgi:hypothetical protein
VNCASAEGIIISTNLAKGWNDAGQAAKHVKLQVEKWDQFLVSAQHRAYCVAIRNKQQWDERGHWGSFGCSEQGMQSGSAAYTLISNTLLPIVKKAAALEDITLTSQGGLDRLLNFDIIATRWPGPKVAVFAINNLTKGHMEGLDEAIELITNKAKAWLNTLVMIHIITDPGVHLFAKSAEFHHTSLYPINMLRNLVVDHAPTNWVFPVDMDFIPSSGVYEAMRGVSLALAGLERPAIVVPHFEQIPTQQQTDNQESNCTSDTIPVDFTTLDSMLRRSRVRPFHNSLKLLGPDFPGIMTKGGWLKTDGFKAKDGIQTQGVVTTDYSTWYSDSVRGQRGGFKLQLGEMFKEANSVNMGWEPFVAVRRMNFPHTLPRYREKFVGRFFNKVSFTLELQTLKYSFFTLREHFLIHCWHKRPAALKSRAFTRNHINDLAVQMKTAYLETIDPKRGPLVKLHQIVQAEQNETTTSQDQDPYNAGWGCIDPLKYLDFHIAKNARQKLYENRTASRAPNGSNWDW